MLGQSMIVKTLEGKWETRKVVEVDDDGFRVDGLPWMLWEDHKRLYWYENEVRLVDGRVCPRGEPAAIKRNIPRKFSIDISAFVLVHGYRPSPADVASWEFAMWKDGELVKVRQTAPLASARSNAVKMARKLGSNRAFLVVDSCLVRNELFV